MGEIALSPLIVISNSDCNRGQYLYRLVQGTVNAVYEPNAKTAFLNASSLFVKPGRKVQRYLVASC